MVSTGYRYHYFWYWPSWKRTCKDETRYDWRVLRKRWWPSGKDRCQNELLVEARVLLLILVGTCHAEAVGQSWRRVALLL